MAAMEFVARQSADRMAELVQLGDARTLLDLGGGPGLYAISFCRRYPELHATIHDLDAALRCAANNVAQSALGNRIALRVGSATDAVLSGPFDVIWVSHVIHLFDRPTVRAMFVACHEALPRGGRLLVRDFIMNGDKTDPLLGSLIALNMWLVGAAYSFDEIRELMTDVGFAETEWLRCEERDAPAVLGSVVAGRKQS